MWLKIIVSIAVVAAVLFALGQFRDTDEAVPTAPPLVETPASAPANVEVVRQPGVERPPSPVPGSGQTAVLVPEVDDSVVTGPAAEVALPQVDGVAEEPSASHSPEAAAQGSDTGAAGMAPEAGTPQSGGAQTAPEANDTGVNGLAPEAGSTYVEGLPPEAGTPQIEGLAPEASDPGASGPAPD